MELKTAEALEKSIEHWQKNVDAETVDDIKLGSKECALCELFAHDDINRHDFCVGCPVYKRTGEKSCGDTPYNKAYRAWHHWKHVYDVGAPKKWKEAATAELEFLKSLRETQ